MRGHADAETLAAFREELLSRRKAGRVSAHLAGCPRCAALDAQLAEVTTLLTHTTAPPMPAALTARIEAALAAEAAARSATGTVPAAAAGVAAPGTAGQEGGHGAAGRRTGRPARDRSWLALRIAAVTAAVAVIAGGGYGVARLLSPGKPTAASLGAASGAAAPNFRNKGPVPRMGGSAGSAALGTNHSASNGTASVHQVVHSGTNYQPGRVGAQASAVLARFGTSKQATPGPAPSAISLPDQSSTALTACITHVARNRAPLLVDVATYQGHPAIIIVLPATNTTKARVLVIAEGCTATKAHIITAAPLPGSR